MSILCLVVDVFPNRLPAFQRLSVPYARRPPAARGSGTPRKRTRRRRGAARGDACARLPRLTPGVMCLTLADPRGPRLRDAKEENAQEAITRMEQYPVRGPSDWGDWSLLSDPAFVELGGYVDALEAGGCRMDSGPAFYSLHKRKVPWSSRCSLGAD